MADKTEGLISGALIVAGACTGLSIILWIAGCDFDDSQKPLNLSYPRNLHMTIDGDAAATRDTTLRVNLSGENVHWMEVGLDSTFAGTEWEAFDSLKLLDVPGREGPVSVYGQFATDGGGTTGVYRESIILDLSTHIDSFMLDSPGDTMEPGDQVFFRVVTSENGLARVNFGDFLAGQELEQSAPLVFEGSYVLPPGIREDSAFATAEFRDIVGNSAPAISWQQSFTILGPALSVAIESTIPLPGAQGYDVYVKNSLCFVSDWFSQIHVIDVTSTLNPFYLKAVRTGDWTFGMDGVDNIIYAADGDAGLSIVALNNQTGAEHLGAVRIEGQPRDVIIEGDFAYVACLLSGLKILDISSLETPREVGGIQLTGYGEHIAVHDQYVYVGGEWGGAVVDVSDPTAPLLLSEFIVEGVPEAMLLHHDNLYFATSEEGIIVYDVRVAHQPRRLKSYRQFRDVEGMTALPPYLFAGGDGRLHVINMSRPDSLYELTQVTGLRRIRGMQVFNDHLFLAEEDEMAILSLFEDGE